MGTIPPVMNDTVHRFSVIEIGGVVMETPGQRYARHLARGPREWGGSDRPAAFYVSPLITDEFLAARRFGPCEFWPVRYFLSLIHWRTVCRRADRDGFVRLKAHYLRRFIHRDLLCRLRERLKDDRFSGGPVVVIDKSKVIGKKCYGYKLTDPYTSTVRVECEDDRLNRLIRDWEARERNRWRPVHHWLLRHFDRLEFDAGRAAAIVAAMVPGPRSRLTPKQYRCQAEDRILLLAERDYRLSVCDYGRVHTNFTSLNKPLRCCLSVDGKPLVGVDVSCCQPLLAGALARRYYRPRGKDRMRTVEYDGEGDPYCLRALREFEDHDGVPADVREFIGLCERGELYQALAGTGGDRARAKQDFLTFLMGRRHYRGPVISASRSRFPSVARMLDDLKSKEHARVAWLLQNLESTLVISRACERLMRQSSDLPVYTLHDGVYTVPEGVRFVRRALRGVFRDIGLNPKLKRIDHTTEQPTNTNQPQPTQPITRARLP
jgi:hypothetical protein